MTIINPAPIVSPGHGSPYRSYREGIDLSGTSPETNTIPASGSLSPTGRTGKLCVKVYLGAGTSPTLVDLRVTATDGTTTSTVFEFAPAVAPALSSNGRVELLIPFKCDMNFTSVSIITDLGGTSPTAELDADLTWEP